MNLTSGKLRDLLLKDEDNESIYCRTLLFATDNELWIGTESGLIFIISVRGSIRTCVVLSMIPILCLICNLFFLQRP